MKCVIVTSIHYQMAAGAQIPGWGRASRRRVPRFRLQEPLYVTVSRSGVADRVPGRALNVCERGMAAVLAGQLVPGESVEVEVRLSGARDPLQTLATVKYQDQLRCGLEFAGISAEQRLAIRGWAKAGKAELTRSLSVGVLERTEAQVRTGKKSGPGGRGPVKAKWRRWAALIVAMLIAGAALWWWRWNRGWQELESGLNSQATSAAEKPQVRVPAEVMEKLLVHRVEPVYPPEARKQNLQGIIALDIVVARDGSVINVRALNGPDLLSRAAMDALRWWKFEPYRLNGEAAVVESTVAVEFKQ